MAEEKTIYLLTAGSYSDYSVHGVFDSRQAILDLFEGDEARLAEGGFKIEEHKLNVCDQEGTYKRSWGASIALKNHHITCHYKPEKSKDVKEGEICSEREYFSWYKVGERGSHTLSNVDSLPPYTRNHWDKLHSNSCISLDHARKLCVEAYQKWLVLKAGV